MLPLQIPEIQKRARPWAEVIDIGPPRGHEYIPTLEDCGTLPSLVEHRHPAGTGVAGHPTTVRSYWRPSEDELARLNAGEAIELAVVYWPMVPVSLNVVAVSS